MLILLHDRYKREMIVNTDIIAHVKEQREGYSHNGYYTLTSTTGGEITIMESPQEIISQIKLWENRMKGIGNEQT